MLQEFNTIYELEKQRQIMVKYCTMKLIVEDWHGVSDAANDIREIDAKLGVLYAIEDSNEKKVCS